MSNLNVPAQPSNSHSVYDGRFSEGVYPEGALEAFAAYYGPEPQETTGATDQYDPYDSNSDGQTEDTLAGSCDPTGGFPR